MQLYEKNDDKKSFGKKLQSLRSSKLISKAKMAKLLNVSPSTYACYENGVTDPSPTALKQIADFFNVSIDSLLNYKVDDFNYSKKFWEDAGYTIEHTFKSSQIVLVPPAQSTPDLNNGIVTLNEQPPSVIFANENSFVQVTSLAIENFAMESEKFKRAFCEKYLTDLLAKK